MLGRILFGFIGEDWRYLDRRFIEKHDHVSSKQKQFL